MTDGQSKTCRGCAYRARDCCEYLAMTGKSRVALGYTKGVKPGMRCGAYTTVAAYRESKAAKEREAREKERKAAFEQERKRKEYERLKKAERAKMRRSIAENRKNAREALQRERDERLAKITQLYNSGMTDAAIAREIGVHPNTITKWRTARNLPSNLKRTDLEPLKEQMACLYAQGLSDKKIAKALGCSSTSVLRWRQNTNRPANH